MSNQKNGYSLATLGGGCFWCLDAIYRNTQGVIDVKSGFAGGDLENPSYKEVVSGLTGHAEVVQVKFNTEITFKELLNIFFSIHDPTQVNRQGNDVGPQYRSIILYHNETQKKEVAEIISKLDKSKTFTNPIATEIRPFQKFFPAEDYHQDYYNRNTNQSYCMYVINPKLQKFRKKHSQFLEL